MDDSVDRDAVVTALADLRDSDDTRLDVDIYSLDKLYDGTKTELAADSLFTVDDFAFAVDPRYSTKDDMVTTGPSSAARSGGHRMTGIYSFAEAGIEPGEGADASLLDISPTILYALDEPVPTSMDGDALTGAFIDEVRETRPISRLPLEQLADVGIAQADRDTDAVEERLENLGYI